MCNQLSQVPCCLPCSYARLGNDIVTCTVKETHTNTHKRPNNSGGSRAPFKGSRLRDTQHHHVTFSCTCLLSSGLHLRSMMHKSVGITTWQHVMDKMITNHQIQLGACLPYCLISHRARRHRYNMALLHISCLIHIPSLSFPLYLSLFTHGWEMLHVHVHL